jgi:hypothetical protein
MMDSIAFQTWLSDFGRKFPAIRNWWRAIDPRDDQDALMDAWQQAVEGLDVEDCLEVNRRILSGELDGPGTHESHWQYVPACIRKNVAILKDRRASDSARRQWEQREETRNLLVRDRLKLGRSREEINRELVAAGYEPIATK